MASPSNYGPMCSTSILYTFFSQLFVKRRQPTPDANQSADQAGFRSGLLHDRPPFHVPASPTATEWHQPLRVAAIHFKKAFVTVEHSSVWKALGSKASRNRTYSYSQSSTTSYEQQCTLTLKANTSISSEEPSRETRAQHALVQLTPSIHHEATNRKVEER